jgi:basic amino acid/polyamine antiporter, APA family
MTLPPNEKVADAPAEPTLRRALGLFELVMIGVGSTVGAGIFVMTGTVAAQYSGPAVVISFAIAGAVCLLAGLCYAELAAMLPQAGSAYSYSRAALGSHVGWMVGWCLILEYLVAASTVAVGWSGYAGHALSQLGIPLPEAIASAPFIVSGNGDLVRSGALLNLPAALIVLLMTALLAVGVRESALANNVMVLVKIGVILLVSAVGILYVNPENWHPFVPPPGDAPGAFGWSGIMRAAAVIFFAYIGFETVSTCAQESRRPQRDLGLGMILALLICTALYIAIAFVMTGLTHYSQLNVPDPILVALEGGGPGLAWLKPVVGAGAVIGLASTILVTLYGQTRIFYTMSRDGVIPPAFARVHPRHRTPLQGILIAGCACAALAALLPLDVLGELVSIGTLLAFTAVCISVPVLRRRSPELARPFRVPFGPVIPVLGALACLYLMYALPTAAWWRLALWLVLGIFVYLCTGRPATKGS